MHNFDETQNRSGQNPDAPPIPGASTPPRARPEVLRTFGRVQLSGKTLESIEAALKAGSLSLLYKSKEREPAAADAGTRPPPPPPKSVFSDRPSPRRAPFWRPFRFLGFWDLRIRGIPALFFLSHPISFFFAEPHPKMCIISTKPKIGLAKTRMRRRFPGPAARRGPARRFCAHLAGCNCLGGHSRL